MSFKLLAIRPLDGCNPKFLKNLQENSIYKFYNDYDFQDSDGNEILNFSNFIEVSQIKNKNSVLEDLYDQGNTKINISAIVGKNGSGKSALVELFYAMIYNLSVDKGIITKFDFEDLFRKENFTTNDFDFLKLTDNKVFENERDYTNFKVKYFAYYNKLKNEIEKNINKRHKNRNKSLYNNKKLSTFLKKWIYHFNHNIIYIVENINLEIYFEIYSNIYRLRYNKNFENAKFIYEIFSLETLKFEEVKQFSMEMFFYTLVTNYSLYGLNSNEVGDWIERIFHKNDGYQTPIVINPYRSKGNIDINSENELVRDRLFFNIVHNYSINNGQIITGKKIEQIYIKLKQTETETFDKNLAKKYFKAFIPEKINLIVGHEFSLLENRILFYIKNKLERIRNNYEIYSDCSFDNVEHLEYLATDNSHICFKIKQSINFIINSIEKTNLVINNLNSYFNEKLSDTTSNEIIKVIKEQELILFCESFTKNSPIELYQNLLPPIFEFDYILNKSLFSDLSSGEKQEIYSINSILYHLIFLDSTKGNDYPNKYNNINVVLDEIELYAHPEMQRKYIKNLLEGISLLKLQKDLNLLFITHSPFILSDIPKQNVLFLEVENGKSKPSSYKGDNTFGENIHQMLTDGFFITDTKGDFVKNKIQKFLSYYNITKDKDNKPTDFDIEINSYNKFIALIGEDYIRNILYNHLDELEVRFGNKTYLGIEEKRLNERLSKILKLKNK